jgi:3-phosphoshikimate 1-carboxyvinyltransferase
MMGAQIDGIRNTEYGIREEYPPITIKGGNLKAITYRMPVASAQAKSAILLAGLYAKGRTKVIQPVLTRDHTERMLRIFKADIKVKKNKIIIKGEKELLSPKRIYIPGDISSASFFIVLAAILPDAQMVIRNVGLNHLRLGIIRVLKRMGAEIEITANSKLSTLNFEPMGDLLVKSSSLRAPRVRKEEIPSLIDELPILMVAACFAKGKTIFEGVQELHVKETDRIRSMSENLKGMGSRIKIIKSNKAEKIIIEGIKQLHGARVRSFGDHRTAMSMVIAGLKAKDKTIIDDVSCISKSFPDFLRILSTLIR